MYTKLWILAWVAGGKQIQHRTGTLALVETSQTQEWIVNREDDETSIRGLLDLRIALDIKQPYQG
jgi:hypothetical protein